MISLPPLKDKKLYVIKKNSFYRLLMLDFDSQHLFDSKYSTFAFAEKTGKEIAKLIDADYVGKI